MRLRDSVHRQFLYSMVFLAVCFGPENGRAQEHGGNTSPSQEPSLSDSIHQLQMQIQQLQTVVQEMKEESGRYRAETLQLKQELQLTRQKLDSIDLPVRARADASPANAEAPLAQDRQSG